MNKRLNKLTLVTVATMVLAVLASCSTQKANWTNIQYHNTTTHYNVWWNGNESLKKGVELMEKNVKDDYTQMLPVYKMGTKEEAMGLKNNFDRTIEKGIKGIKKHSIFVDGREHVPYIPKSYLMTAYATFYEHDFTATASTCQMMVSQYTGTEVADEAAVLLARCATQEKHYQDAESSLDELVVRLGKGAFDRHQKLNLYLAMAECTLPQEKYKKGVQFLKMALDEHPSSQQKARIYFILGQVYQQLDKRPTASKYYEKVLKSNPSYEMEFNARLNIASCADLQHTDREKLERLLDRMLKDKKNEDFLDQIYFAKGEMYMGMREHKKACENFKRSVAVSKNNQAQKARSAIRLGGILYDKFEDYDQSQLYYDTAMAIIKPDYPRYSNIKSRYDLLTSLVSYTRVYERNDSLIAVADMPAGQRMELIKQKIAEVRQAEKEAKERELMEQLSSDSQSQKNTLQGDWYFYNSNTVQKGKETFRQRWGVRGLEDYWFLSKKGLLGMNMLGGEPESENTEEDEAEDSGEEDEATEKQPGGNPNDPHDVAYYTKDLPQTDSARSVLLEQTANCLLNAGYIYYDGINNIPKALECYLRLTNDFTSNSEIAQAFYMLYKIYDKQGNTPNANYYKDMVLMGFPDSDFSNLILDEDYYKEIIHRSMVIREDYEAVYNLYRKHRYGEVVKEVAVAKELYEGNPMLGKFKYWEGLSYVRMDNKQQAVATFQGIVKDYPATDTIVVLAQQQLDYLLGEGGQYVANSGADEPILEDFDLAVAAEKRKQSKIEIGNNVEDKALSQEATLFRYKDNITHFVIILMNDKKIRATVMQSKVGDFNMVYYANSGFTVKPLLFNDSTQMVTISRFNTAAEAMDYYRHLLREEGPLVDYEEADYKVFAISQQNYTTFYKRKKIDAYKEFFDKYYLNK